MLTKETPFSVLCHYKNLVDFQRHLSNLDTGWILAVWLSRPSLGFPYLWHTARIAIGWNPKKGERGKESTVYSSWYNNRRLIVVPSTSAAEVFYIRFEWCPMAISFVMLLSCVLSSPFGVVQFDENLELL